jgi:hypothetical protein
MGKQMRTGKVALLHSAQRMITKWLVAVSKAQLNAIFTPITHPAPQIKNRPVPPVLPVSSHASLPC